jgi:DNA-binding PadR family transcriptional regulator
MIPKNLRNGEIVMINIVQTCILQIIKDDPQNTKYIAEQLIKAGIKKASTTEDMIYYYINQLKKLKLVDVMKSKGIPPKLSIKITNSGRILLKNFASLFQEKKASRPLTELPFRRERKDIDDESIKEIKDSIETVMITEYLHKELENVTGDERDQIQEFIDKIVKIIKMNI